MRWWFAVGAWLAVLGLGGCFEGESGAGEGGDAGDKNEQPSTTPVEGTGYVHSQGELVIGADGEPLLMRCVNLDSWLTPTPYLVSDSGNALFVSPAEFRGRLDEVVGAERAERFWTDWRDRFVTEHDIRRIGELGFNCARLVLYYRGFALVDGSDVTLDDAALTYVDSAVAWGQKHGVYIVLDLHAAPGGQNGVPTVSDVPSTDPVPRLFEGATAAANQHATVALWRALAERYRDARAVAGYDLLNEPALPDNVDSSALVELYGRIIGAIRQVDPHHMVILEGDDFAHDFTAFEAPLDDNMGYSFHAYALTGLEGWAEPGGEDLKPYLELREAHNRPLWLGEFGENTLEWQEQMVQLMEDHDIGWALYPWKRKQTWFWNPVVQLVPAAPQWYALASYLAQPAGGDVAVPTEAQAEAAMSEYLDAILLENCREHGTLASTLVPSP